MMKQPVKNKTMIIWVSKILRWSLGVLFIVWGILADHDWYTISFGCIILATGFLKPRRCIDENCDIPSRK
ncbi:MAG TPA: hypothetical protein VLD19_03455 [Chitinophagaceae bacterium]|nr:hypothetical protein [Chitinophagaceae bacterium]